MIIKNKILQWFFIALGIKGVLFLFFVYSFNKNYPKDKLINYIFAESKDFHSYIDPVQNLVDFGEYYEDAYSEKLYAHKMPGMLPVFAPLYYLFGTKTAFTLLVILQLMADSFATVLVSLIALRIFNKKRIFYFTFALYALSTYVSVFTHYAMSESLCAFFLVLTLYFFQLSLLNETKTKRYLVYTGLFAAWTVFFRPSYVILLIGLPIILFLLNGKPYFRNFKSFIFKCIIFISPFLIVESAWIIRNEITLHRFIPTDISLEKFGTPKLRAMFSFVKAFGGDLQSWNPKSEMRWFAPKSDKYSYDSSFANASDAPFPNYLFTEKFTIDTLKILRKKYDYSSNPDLSNIEKHETEAEVIRLCKKYEEEFKTEKSIFYHFVAPLRTMIQLVFIKQTYSLPLIKNNIVEKVARILFLGTYYLILLSSFLSFLYLCLSKQTKQTMFYWIFILHVFLIGFLLRLTENRYLVPVYPIVCIYSAFAFNVLIEKLRMQNLLKK